MALNQTAKKLVEQISLRFGIGLYRIRGRYIQDGMVSVHSDEFRRDGAFRAAYARGVQASHGVDPGFEWRIHIALWAAQSSLRVEGDFVECGVNAGFISSAIMHYLEWNKIPRRFFLIDTFAGPVLSQYSAAEIENGRLQFARQAIQAGAYVTDLQRIRANFAEWPNAVIVPGAVPQVLQTVEWNRVAFLHLDMNCALPETSALEFFWPRLSSGGMVLLDDYAYHANEAHRAELDACALRTGGRILSLPTGQGLMIK